MPMSLIELQKALRSLRLSGMSATLEARAMQLATGECNFLEGVSWLVQDELDRRHTRLIDRRFAKSGLTERATLQNFDWGYNPKLPKREILELATLKYIDAKENALLIGKPGTGKSRVAKAIAMTAIEQGYRVFYREAHMLIYEIHEMRQLGEIAKYRTELANADLAVIDDLFLRRLPSSAGDEIADVLMSRYEKSSTLVTSNRPIEDWPSLLGGDVVLVAPLLDRLMHHGHLLKFEGRSWRLREAAERVATQAATA